VTPCEHPCEFSHSQLKGRSRRTNRVDNDGVSHTARPSERSLALKLTVAFDRTIGRASYRVHLRLYRLTRGIIGHRSPAGPMLILESIGHRTGIVRSNPLLYVAREGRYFVVASNGGRARNPGWLFNVRNHEVVKVQAGSKKFNAVARELNDDERNAVWPMLTSSYGGWAHYETLTDRSLRVIELTPTS